MNNPSNPTNAYTVPSVSITTARTGASSKANALGMRAMQERAYAKRGEQYLLIKSPPASGKSRALMFIALDKLHNQGLRQAIVVVPERSIGSSFADELLSQHGFDWDWQVAPQWNLCNAPGVDDVKVAKSKVKAVGEFLASADKVLVCTHATFRFAVEELGLEAFDNRLIARLDVLIDGRYVARDRLATGLRGSANQNIQLLTDRYTRADVEATPVAEIRIGKAGELVLTGVDPLKLRR